MILPGTSERMFERMPEERRETPEAEEDRAVADMNVEGMPWYREGRPAPKNPDAEPMSRRNLWRYTLSAVGAGLTIVFVFGLAAAAFIWFCINVWFR